MQTKRERRQEELFIASPLSALIPDDHMLKRVDRILDLCWIHDAVRGCYCQDNGRPSIDPEAALRLMLAGFFYRITGDRELMREAQVNLAIRWFMGYRLDEALPDRSSLTRRFASGGAMPCTARCSSARSSSAWPRGWSTRRRCTSTRR